MKVVFFHRKRLPGYYSMEDLFDRIRRLLPGEIECEVREMKYSSSGIFKRLLLCIEAAWAQKDINHITGDIHFIAAFLRKRKTVLTIHDVGFMSRPSALERSILKWFWITMPLRRCAVVTTVSTATKNEILKYSSIHPSRIKVIHNPVSNQFVPMPKVFNKTEPVILQIGTKQNKNIPRLIKALSGIRCRFDIVGEASDNLVRELRNSNINYTLSKDLTREEIVGKYASADILVFASTSEGFGLPILEANAIGRVVVTSNTSSMPEVANDAAEFVDPYDIASVREGILKVITDDVHREKLIQKGFLNVKRFGLQQIVDKYTEVYRSLS